MSKATTLLGLAMLGGGVYYLVSRKPSPDKYGNCPEGYHRMPDGTCMKNEDMPGYTPGADAYSPPGWAELLGTYQAAIYGHATPGDCARLQDYLDSLQGENASEDAWIEERKREVNVACALGPTPVASNPPVLPSWIPPNLVNGFNYCWSTLSCGDTADVVNAITAVIENYTGLVPPEQAQQAYNALNDLQRRYANIGDAMRARGIGRFSGAPHVGDCGCASCAAKRDGVGQDEEPCCDACAAGVGSCSCSMQSQQRLEEQPFTQGRV